MRYLWVFLFSSTCLGWADHYRITEEMIRDMELPQQEVPYISFEKAIKRGVRGISGSSLDEFLAEYKLNKKFKFQNKLSEKEGRVVSVFSLLSIYTDEPDWGCDENLFEPDQYPELWTEDTKYIAQKKGNGSKGFRHMYFSGKWNWKEPIASYQIPMKPIGEAPRRAELFQKLSKAFFEAQMPYWGYRFLAWTLHFIEDLYQPFHVRQTPTKKFIKLNWKWLIIPKINIEATAEQIAYYHYSFERWMADQFELTTNSLKDAVSGKSLEKPFDKPISDYIAFDVIPFSSSYAVELGRATHNVFAKFPPEPGIKAEEFVGTHAWRGSIGKNQDELNKMIRVSEILYRKMGDVCRRLIVDTAS